MQRFRHTLETGESSFAPASITQMSDGGFAEFSNWRADRTSLGDGRFGVICYFTEFSAVELARSEERFRAFVTASADVVYQMSADWSEMRHLRGRNFIANTENPTGSWLDKYIHPGDRAHVWEEIQQAIRTKGVFELEHRVIRVDGSLGWTFSRAIPMLDARGEIVEWLGAARDITSRKEAEGAVARLTAHSENQRRLYETILSSTPDLVYVFDVEHRFTYANKALLTMWGKNAEEAIGKTCLELGYEPWHAAMHDREIEQVIATKQAIRGEVPFSGTHGRRIYDYIFVPVIGPSGEVDAIASATRDVTERQMAEEELRRTNQELERANRSLEEFAYVASHDLQEPLRMINIYTQLILKNGNADEEKRNQYASFVNGGVQRMERLIRDLLTFSRTIHTEEALAGTVDLSAALAETLSVLRVRIEESGARIVASPLPVVPGDAQQLACVFQNLLENAIKYCRPDHIPEITITAVREREHWIVAFQDNGIGFEPHYATQVFGLFKRLHRDEYPGAGLGLAICQRIVERYGGRMWAESQPGTGSTFFLSLPCVEREPA